MSFQKDSIHVAVCFDQHYVTPLYVLLTSIFSHNKNNHLVFHSIASGVTEDQKLEIAQFVEENNAEIFFYKIHPGKLQGLVIPENTWFSVAAYYRLFFPSLVVPGVERLLYIDVDTVVIKDLSELYNLSIQGKPVGAVRERIGEIRPEIGNSDPDSYFNSGVMLMNVGEWKRQRVTERALQFVYDNPEAIKCVDQDALNAVLIDNWYVIDKKYNVMFQDVPRTLASRNFRSYLNDKVIIHFSMGRHKPWCALGENRFRYLYHQYRRRSPRRHERKYTDFKVSGPFLYRFAKIRVVEVTRNHPKVLTALVGLKHIVTALLEI